MVLPDPDDAQTVAELARRFSYNDQKLKDLILEAHKDFLELAKIAATKGSEVGIWYLASAPVYTFYRFDSKGIFALYNHIKRREPVPTIVCHEGGTLYEFFMKEFRAMVATDGLARRV